LSAVAASYDGPDIGPALTPLYPELMARIETAGVRMTGAPIAYYLPAPEHGDDAITVHAAFPVAADPSDDHGFAVVDLPPVETAATLLHHGPMSEVDGTVQVLARWIDDNGYRTVAPGFAREVYLDCPPDGQQKWITEMQLPVTRDQP
jgi:effector-binding domain-containing protein